MGRCHAHAWVPHRGRQYRDGPFGRAEALALVLRQWAFVAGAGALMVTLWRRGVARFAAYGG